jgi:hypothetical protein
MIIYDAIKIRRFAGEGCNSVRPSGTQTLKIQSGCPHKLPGGGRVIAGHFIDLLPEGI